MGHKNKASLTRQVQNELDRRLRIGQGKHSAKRDGTASSGVYCWSTYKTYMRHANYFVAWCKEHYGCKTLQQCRQHAEEWIAERAQLAASSQKVEVCALAKLYGCTSADIVASTPVRRRCDITRSRGSKVRDAHFSEERHADLVSFCRSTGLRRQELRCLTGDKLVYVNGAPHIRVDVGSKGGRLRIAPVIGDVELVVRLMQAAGSGKVWPQIPNGADIHAYRADYATAIYKAVARPYEVCKVTPFYNAEHSNGKGQAKGGWDKDSVYHMRGDRKGDWLDKAAMLAASKALGHNRISVVGSHYIRSDDDASD